MLLKLSMSWVFNLHGGAVLAHDGGWCASSDLIHEAHQGYLDVSLWPELSLNAPSFQIHLKCICGFCCSCTLSVQRMLVPLVLLG